MIQTYPKIVAGYDILPAMALFNRQPKPALGTSLKIKAAVANPSNVQAASGDETVKRHAPIYAESGDRNRAMSVPAISRSRDLLASVVSGAPLQMYSETWNADEQKFDRTFIQPRPWLRQIDLDVPNVFTLAWTFEDAFFHGRAMWYITSRYTSDGLPASFTRLPIAAVTTPNQVGPMFYTPAKEILFQGYEIDPANVVQFLSPVEGIIYQSPNVINIALRLEQARFRNASASQPAGVLKQLSGEPLSGQELSEMALAFNAARMNNQTAAISENLSYTETAGTPDKMMLIDASDYTARDCVRLTNVPGYLVELETGSYSYQSGPQARADLYQFGARNYMEMIAQTLSMNNVTPPGQYIRFDIESYLAETVVANVAATEPLAEITPIRKEAVA